MPGLYCYSNIFMPWVTTSVIRITEVGVAAAREAGYFFSMYMCGEAVAHATFSPNIGCTSGLLTV